MRRYSALLVLALVTQAYTAPQFITFKDGKLGVNFGGYHAGVGIGGLLNGGSGGSGGAGGGLYAEAGTPYGPAAKAGLGGVVDGNGGSAGGLYAGATAGGNVRAAAGLGGVAAENTAGGGFATAQAGNHHAASGLGGASSVEGSAGFKYAGATKSYVEPSVVKEVAIIPLESKPVETEKKAHAEFNFEAANEVKPLPLSPVEAHAQADANVDVSASAPIVPAVTVIDESQPPQVTRFHEKHIVHTHYKPHKHHAVHKTAYIGGFLGADVPPPPQIQRRVDVGAEAAGNVGYGHQGAGQITHEVTVQKNPNFFQDIFNIPISTLKAVGNFLSNTAGSTNVSVQKSASVHADSDSSPKHAASSSSSEAHISVETPSASQIIDDIFAIPINTLGAVNKFLENNVGNRKRITVSQTESGEPTRVRLGPHARRRLNKHVVIVEEKAEEKPEAET